jgi:hypothetical protein
MKSLILLIVYLLFCHVSSSTSPSRGNLGEVWSVKRAAYKIQKKQQQQIASLRKKLRMAKSKLKD